MRFSLDSQHLPVFTFCYKTHSFHFKCFLVLNWLNFSKKSLKRLIKLGDELLAFNLFESRHFCMLIDKSWTCGNLKKLFISINHFQTYTAPAIRYLLCFFNVKFWKLFYLNFMFFFACCATALYMDLKSRRKKLVKS